MCFQAIQLWRVKTVADLVYIPKILHDVCGFRTAVHELIIHIINSLLPNDAIWCHDLCKLSISLWEFIWGFSTRRYTVVQGFCFFWLFLMGCKGFHKQLGELCEQ